MTGKSGRAGLANVPADYRLTTTANSPARKEQAQAYRLIDAYVKTFERQFDDKAEQGGKDTHNRIKSLYLFSESPGTGKTTTASAVLNEWIVTHYVGSVKRGRQPLQLPAYFLDVNEWQTLFLGFNRGNIPQDIAEQYSRPYYTSMEKAKHAPFAVIDDIGVRGATDAFRGDLHTIINYRTANGLPTVYTSNLPIEDMAQVFDARLYDRMRDMCVPIEFEGGSKRGMRK
ncbi:DNA replication protein [Robertmurraya andreesenii]|uniref:DNA replication protein DnaC n=1 Tax=Anoxybacillus andreesenii TaxID=1325932 RepID=A0ABT9V208_9BACL|nr:DNA replication protein [Robertmurraya andreesenii]MDQ0154976.1 DNA replication protein DnaC [Robertmurraya andreesenii]